MLFRSDAGHVHQRKFAKLKLKLGETYIVNKTIVGAWETIVVLEELPDHKFNSVFFEDIFPQSEEDDKRHEYYNYYH